jgi:hypothetical protein
MAVPTAIRYIRHWRTIVVGVLQIVPKGRYIRHSGTIVVGVRTVVPKCRTRRHTGTARRQRRDQHSFWHSLLCA